AVVDRIERRLVQRARAGIGRAGLLKDAIEAEYIQAPFPYANVCDLLQCRLSHTETRINGAAAKRCDDAAGLAAAAGGADRRGGRLRRTASGRDAAAGGEPHGCAAVSHSAGADRICQGEEGAEEVGGAIPP